MDNTNQSTILVKKADGTSVRMTLGELNEMKKAKTQISLTDAQKEVNKIAMERRSEEMTEANLKNVKIENLATLKKPEVFSVSGMPLLDTDEELDIGWGKEDHQSLLEEIPTTDLPMVIPEGGSAIAKKENTPFSFPDKITHDEIAVAQHIDHKPHTTEQIMAEKTTNSQKEEMKPAKQEPKFKAPSSLNFDTKPIINAADAKFSIQSIVPAIKAPEFKPIISDVRPPIIEKRSMGPIDEIKNFSITDFRRLGANSEASGAKLLDKFKSLEKDSYLLFMEGIEAWYNSPLYKQYQDIISQSLKQGKTLGQFLAQNDSPKVLRLDEFKTILKINQAIR